MTLSNVLSFLKVFIFCNSSKFTNLTQFCVLLETPVAQVNGTGGLLRVPALLGLDLNGEGVAKGVVQVVGGEKDTIRTQYNAMAHNIFFASL